MQLCFPEKIKVVFLKQHKEKKISKFSNFFYAYFLFEKFMNFFKLSRFCTTWRRTYEIDFSFIRAEQISHAYSAGPFVKFSLSLVVKYYISF